MHDHEAVLTVFAAGEQLRTRLATDVCWQTLRGMQGTDVGLLQPAAVSAARLDEVSAQQPTQRSQSVAASASTLRDQLPVSSTATPSQDITARLSAADNPLPARHDTVAVDVHQGGQCGKSAGGVHRCGKCNALMRASCSTAVDPEDYGVGARSVPINGSPSMWILISSL